MRVDLETGLLSNFLTRSLRTRDIPAICLEARHAKAALRLQINKTDANDAVGLAQVTRTGWLVVARTLRRELGISQGRGMSLGR